MAEPVENRFGPVCPFLEHTFETQYDIGMMEKACSKCGTILLDANMVNDWDGVILFPRVYHRTQYYLRIMGMWAGVEDPWQDIYTSYLIRIFEAIPRTTTWTEVFKAFRAECQPLAYTRFGEWCKRFNYRELYDPSILERIVSIDEENDKLIEKFGWTTKKCFNFWYMFMKCAELVTGPKAGPVNWVPCKITRTTIKKLDEKWKEVCEHFGWEFKPSKPQKFTWDKEKILGLMKTPCGQEK